MIDDLFIVYNVLPQQVIIYKICMVFLRPSHTMRFGGFGQNASGRPEQRITQVLIVDFTLERFVGIGGFLQLIDRNMLRSGGMLIDGMGKRNTLYHTAHDTLSVLAVAFLN